MLINILKQSTFFLPDICRKVCDKILRSPHFFKKMWTASKPLLLQVLRHFFTQSTLHVCFMTFFVLKFFRFSNSTFFVKKVHILQNIFF